MRVTDEGVKNGLTSITFIVPMVTLLSIGVALISWLNGIENKVEIVSERQIYSAERLNKIEAKLDNFYRNAGSQPPGYSTSKELNK